MGADTCLTRYQYALTGDHLGEDLLLSFGLESRHAPLLHRDLDVRALGETAHLGVEVDLQEVVGGRELDASDRGDAWILSDGLGHAKTSGLEVDGHDAETHDPLHAHALVEGIGAALDGEPRDDGLPQIGDAANRLGVRAA